MSSISAVEETPIMVNAFSSDVAIPFAVETMKDFAKSARGKFVTSPPPFVIACTDGVLVVFNVMRRGEVQSASALLLPEEFDCASYPLTCFWRQTEKTSLSEDKLRELGLSEQARMK